MNILKENIVGNRVDDLIAELKPIHEAINSISQAKQLDDVKFDAISNSIKTLRNKHIINN